MQLRSKITVARNSRIHHSLLMHQSIPAVPIPPRALAGYLLMFQSRGGIGILSLPGGRAYAYPRNDPGTFDIFVRFWSRM